MVISPLNHMFWRSVAEAILIDRHMLFYGEFWYLCKKYLKVPKFSDAKKLCCNLPKFQRKRPNLWVFHLKEANGIANSEDPDQTALLGTV